MKPPLSALPLLWGVEWLPNMPGQGLALRAAILATRRIMHGYEGVQLEAVWNVATIHLPHLVSQVEPPTSLVEAP